jgi:ubiquinone biosynthesis protein
MLDAMSIISLPRTGRALQRLVHILNVLSRHGFGHFVERVDLRRYLPISGGASTRIPAEPEMDTLAGIGNRLVQVCEELGPTFVKLGQTAASRPDLVPAPIVKALTRLQSHVAPFDYGDVERIVRGDLGESIEQLYGTFERAPLASGSIAQVHAATLKDGRDVVVKVKRPGIDAIVRLDMHVLKWLAELSAEYIPEMAVYRPLTIYEEFARSLDHELDFLFEASATQRFGAAFADAPHVRIPGIEWDLTGVGVLTMQRMTGRSMEDVLLNGVDGVNRIDLARHLADCFLRQYFETGLFHADPHPGNLLVYLPDHIGLIDFGMVGQVHDELRGQLIVALVATIQREVDIVIDVLADLGSLGENTNRKTLRRELRTLLEKYYGQPLKRLNLRTIFFEITDLMRRHDVALPRDFVMLGKSLVTVAGVALQLDPNLNLLELIRPKLKRMVSERLSPHRLLRRFVMGSWHVAAVLGEMPRNLRDAMRTMSSGQFKVNIQHNNLDHLANEIDRSSNRMAFSIFLAATIIGSSMLVRIPASDAIFGISLRAFGFIGFAASLFMGLWLLIAILRSGKLS